LISILNGLAYLAIGILGLVLALAIIIKIFKKTKVYLLLLKNYTILFGSVFLLSYGATLTLRYFKILEIEETELMWYSIYTSLFILSISIITDIKYTFKKKRKKKIGANFEKEVGKVYEIEGYSVDYRGLKLGHLDGGIDLIAKKGNQTILVQCKFWFKKNSIKHNMVKEFFGNCHLLINKDKYPQSKKENVLCIYAIPTNSCLSASAYHVFKNNYAVLRYRIFDVNKSVIFGER
jgi:hypothetical protein